AAARLERIAAREQARRLHREARRLLCPSELHESTRLLEREPRAVDGVARRQELAAAPEQLERLLRVTAVELHVGEELVRPRGVLRVLGQLQDLERLPRVAGS